MRIIYKNTDNTVGVLIPVQEVIDSVGIQVIADKDVPESLPYWIVNETDIPSDRTDRNRWVLENMPEPDGFGGVSNEFTDAQLLALYNAGAIQ